MALVLGIDFGERRVGLALSDPSATIAQPLPTLTRRAGKRPPIAAIIEIIQQNPGPSAPSRVAYPLLFRNNRWTIDNDRVLGWLRKKARE